MKEINFGYVFLVLIHFSCTVQKEAITGQYNSTCALYGNQSNVILMILEDGSFYYKRPYVDENVVGTWTVLRNNLILKSESFEAFNENEYAPRVKYTDAEREDVYLIRGEKLKPASENGFSNQCHLRKIKNSP